MPNEQDLSGGQRALIDSLLVRLDRTQPWVEQGVPIAGQWEGVALPARFSGEGFGLSIRQGEPIRRFVGSLWLVARIGGDGVYTELRSLAVSGGRTRWAPLATLQAILDTCAPLVAAWDASTAQRLAAMDAVEAVGAAQRPAQPARPAGIDAETWMALPAYKRRRLLQEQRAAQV